MEHGARNRLGTRYRTSLAAEDFFLNNPQLKLDIVVYNLMKSKAH